MLKWGEGIDVGDIRKLLSEREYDSETQSILYYLIALQSEWLGKSKETAEAIAISVEKCSDHVNNLLMCAKYFEDKAYFCHQMAKKNYKRISCSDIKSYIDPHIFIGEHISGIYGFDDSL